MSRTGNSIIFQPYKHALAAWGWLLLFILAACVGPQRSQEDILVTVMENDGQTQVVQVPAGSTAQQVIGAADIELGPLDHSDPALYTVVTDGAEVRVIRGREDFTIEQEIVPFEHQTMRNESLPVGETRLVQPGLNGIREITYRHYYEDDALVSTTVVKTVDIQTAVPEIIMIGSQSAFTSVPMPGRLVYLTGGNAWYMEGATNNRQPIVLTGDLDGRVFSLSLDGEWLLFTRLAEDEDVINTLWAVKVSLGEDLMIDLGVENVINFADWKPASTLTVAFSTVEPRSTAPGWQANNDLNTLSFRSDGWVSNWRVALPSNSGGLYGWWGTTFAWAPDGQQLAYARPDEIGVLDLLEETLRPQLKLTPFQTRSDWAWIPPIAWSPNGDILYAVNHGHGAGLVSPEESQVFNLVGLALDPRLMLPFAAEVGMFAAPVPSRVFTEGANLGGYLMAFLQAISPTQSETSRYQLIVSDRDGSNKRVLFPPEGAPGVGPHTVAWSPEKMPGKEGDAIAVLYQGNLWLVDLTSGEAQQLTGDGLTTRVEWTVSE